VNTGSHTFAYAPGTFQNSSWTFSAANHTVTLTTGSAHGLVTGNVITVAAFGGAQACMNVANASVTVGSSTTFTYSVPAACNPGASGNQKGTITLVTAASHSVGGTVTLTTLPATNSGGTVTAPGYIAAINITCNGCATVTDVPSTADSGTFSPAWMPTAGVVGNASGSTAAPSPLKISSGTVTLQPGTYYGGICIGAASGNDCVGAHCLPSVASSPVVTLMPGIYILAGGGFQVCGHATLDAPNVLLYNTNDQFAPVIGTYAAVGQIELNTAGTVTLGPQTLDQDPLYAGFTIFEDRAQVVDPPTCTPIAYNPVQSLTSSISNSGRLLQRDRHDADDLSRQRDRDRQREDDGDRGEDEQRHVEHRYRHPRLRRHDAGRAFRGHRGQERELRWRHLRQQGQHCAWR